MTGETQFNGKKLWDAWITSRAECTDFKAEFCKLFPQGKLCSGDQFEDALKQFRMKLDLVDKKNKEKNKAERKKKAAAEKAKQAAAAKAAVPEKVVAEKVPSEKEAGAEPAAEGPGVASSEVPPSPTPAGATGAQDSPGTTACIHSSATRT